MAFSKNLNSKQLTLVFAGAGLGLSMLLSINQAPQPSVYNEVASIVFFGLLSAACLCSLSSISPSAALRIAWPVWLPLLILFASALVSWSASLLPGGLTASYLGTLTAAALLATSGAMIRRSVDSCVVIRRILVVVIIVGCINSFIAFVQIFHPPTQDGGLIAMSHDIGRAVGNLRQPNQLSSLLLWAVASCVVWLERKPSFRVSIVVIVFFLIVANALTKSRTGMLGLLLLVAWGISGRALSRSSRLVMITSPIVYATGFLAAHLWGSVEPNSMARVALGDDATAHRLAIWREAGSLITQNPLSGVGFGQFNFAWTLTQFPNRPGELFDNAHNIFVQLAVEIGLPLTAIVAACIAIMAYRIRQQARSPYSTVELAAVSFMLCVILLHSLLEFPLWYPHFLMPTALLAGWAVAAETPKQCHLRRRRWMMIPGLLCACVAIAALFDYQRVSSLYSKDNIDVPLQGRLLVASKSVFFGYHADYALATLTSQPILTKDEIGRATHVMLDPRLMIVWVKALQEANDLERARYLVERIREFRGLNSPIYESFLAACDAAPKTADNPCLPSTKRLSWRDFQDYPLH